MASRAPIIRQVSWRATLPQFIALGAAVSIGYLFAGRHGVLLGSFLYLAYSVGSRQAICKAHRAGIVLVKQQRFEEAIPKFRESYEFFERHPWIDQFRSCVLMSPSAAGYREMALCNIGFCYSQIGNGEQCRLHYQRCLERFPESGLATAALRMLDSTVTAAVPAS